MVLEENIYRRTHVVLLALIAFTFPFPLILNSGLIILCAVLSLVQGYFLKGIKNASKDRYSLLLWLFFLLYIISAFISNNQHEGFAIVERKASFFLLPLLMFTFHLSMPEIKKISLFFVSGVLSAFVICVSVALYRFLFIIHDPDVFFYQKFASVIKTNAVYMAAYSVIALHIVFYFYKALSKALVVVISLVLIVFCILLNSKMMLACLCFGLIIFAFKKLKPVRAFVFSSCILGSALFVSIAVPKVKERIALEVNSNMSVVKLDTFKYNTPFTGTSLRLVFWRFSKEILSEHNSWLMGVQSGDFQDLLNEKYKSKGIYAGNPDLKDTGYLGYGPHNQYIEVLLSLGIIGLAVFLALLVFYMRSAWLSGNYLALQCILLFLFFFFSESALSVNKGVVAFVFFTLLFNSLNSESKHSGDK